MRWDGKVHDDAGKAVDCFDCWNIARDERHDERLVELKDRLTSADSIRPFWKHPTEAAGIVLVWIAAIAAFLAIERVFGLLGRGRHVALPLGLGVGCIMAAAYASWRIRFSRLARMVVRSALAEGRCGSCGYTMSELKTEGMEIVTCPECGAVWRRDRLGTPPVSIPRTARNWVSWLSLKEKRWAALPIEDARGRVVRLAGHPELSAIGAIGERLEACVARATRARRWLLATVWSVLLLLLLAMLWFIVVDEWPTGKRIRCISNALVPALIAIATIGALVHLVAKSAVGYGRVFVRPTMAALLREQRCPSCLGPIEPSPLESRTSVCSGCGSYW